MKINWWEYCCSCVPLCNVACSFPNKLHDESPSEKMINSSSDRREIPCILCNPESMTVFTTARHVSLSWARSIQSRSQPVSSRYVTILSPHLRLGFSSYPFPWVSPPKPCMHLSFPHTCRMFSPSHCSFSWSPGGVRNMKPIPVAARSKVWVCGRSLDGIAGSNPAEGMGVCLLWVLCVVR